MLICRDSTKLPRLERPLVAALGNFDGVHTGHQVLLQRMALYSQRMGGYERAVLSFYPHPLKVLAPSRHEPPLSTFRQKAALLEAAGVTLFVPLHFTRRVSQISAGEFVDQVLGAFLQVQHLVIGADACVGRAREGNADYLVAAMARRGATAEVVPFVRDQSGEKIGSGQIRRLVTEGRMDLVRNALGRSYALEGRVVRGDGRGRTIGFPTANVRTSQLLPANGVYSSEVAIGERRFRAVTNIGVRPTFTSAVTPVMEAHLLDYPGEPFYGQRVTVELGERIRGEQRFSSAVELVAQIARDIERVRELSRIEPPR